MTITTIGYHPDKPVGASIGAKENVLRIGDDVYNSAITIFFPKGTDVRPIVDAINAAKVYPAPAPAPQADEVQF